MWNNFEGLARTREQTLERINTLQWTDWRPQGITLHNTAAPTLEQWAETGPRHDARIRNLQSYYENDKGWHAGPHYRDVAALFQQARERLKPNGCLYVMLSSASDLDLLGQLINKAGLRAKLAYERSFYVESMILYELRPS
jgi:hypothetical protein